MTFGLDYRISFLIDPLAFDLDLSPTHSPHPSQSDYSSMQKDHIIPCLTQYIIQNPFYIFLLHFTVKPIKLGTLLALPSFVLSVTCIVPYT